jgi:hypothetical protein
MAVFADRDDSSRLKGRLSKVIVPALLSNDLNQLLRRLGDRATFDDPQFGRATGGTALSGTISRVSSWLTEHSGVFEATSSLAGPEHDVTDGVVSLQYGERTVFLPIAVMVEKGREREIEIRLYYSLKAIRAEGPPRIAPLPLHDEALSLPPPLSAYLEAVSRGDLEQIAANFESGATLSAGDGTVYSQEADGPSMKEYFSRLVSSEGGTTMSKRARVDDGRACAIEYVTTRLRGRDVVSIAGLAVYERGDSGLLRAVRSYDDVG